MLIFGQMSPENRTYISSHQFNSRPSVPGAPALRGAGQPMAGHAPARPLNVQPRSIANPFHALHSELSKRRIYDRLHPRNMYRAVVSEPRPDQPDPNDKTVWRRSDHE